MLVLSRKVDEAIQIDKRIRVTIVRIKGNKVRVGIEAPDEVSIMRSELDDWSELSFDDCTESESPTDAMTCAGNGFVI